MESAAEAPWLLPLAFALAGIGLVVLILGIRYLLRLIQGAVLARLPLDEHQSVPLDVAGKVVLWGEVPIGQAQGRGRSQPRAFRNLTFRVLDAATGVEIPVHKALLPTRVAGFRRARVALRHFTLERPGPVDLHIEGGLGERDPEAQVLLTRAHGFRLVGAILAIVLGGILLNGGVVLGLILAQGG